MRSLTTHAWICGPREGGPQIDRRRSDDREHRVCPAEPVARCRCSADVGMRLRRATGPERNRRSLWHDHGSRHLHGNLVAKLPARRALSLERHVAPTALLLPTRPNQCRGGANAGKTNTAPSSARWQGTIARHFFARRYRKRDSERGGPRALLARTGFDTGGHLPTALEQGIPVTVRVSLAERRQWRNWFAPPLATNH